MLEIVCGWEPREAIGFSVFEFSMYRRTTRPLRIIPLMEKALRQSGLYRRPHEQRDGQLWCPISDAPMATSFANSRFLLPWLAREPWALFVDGSDMLVVDDIANLFAQADDRYAVMVAKRNHVPDESQKMDGQKQTRYRRKNWSSVCLWNLRHPSNKKLTIAMVNSLPGRDLHRFSWLEDSEIGDLPREWNYLVGVDKGPTARLLHFTKGIPTMPGYEDGPWADVWKNEWTIMECSTSRKEMVPTARVA